MAKVAHHYTNGAGIKHYLFYCPGCQCHHSINDRWSFNGDFDKPTFSPSVLVRSTKSISEDEAERITHGEHIRPIPQVCHSFVADGKIEFLSDCTHAFAGQTVELPEVN